MNRQQQTRRPWRMFLVGAVALAGLTACTSGGSTPGGSSSCDAQCQSDIVDACAGSCAPDPQYPPSVQAAMGSAVSGDDNAGVASVDPDSPEGVTCADWTTVLSSDTKHLLAEGYLNTYGDPNVAEDEDAAIGIIDTTCKAYGAKETPNHIMKVAIATLNASNNP